jgi:hypothetical protein
MHLFYLAIRDGIERGRFHTPYPTEAARGIITMCTAVATWYRKPGPLSPEEIANRYAELALAMVGHAPPAST